MKNKWSKNFDKCIKCGTIKIRHHAKGFCYKCYNQSSKYTEYQRKYQRTPKRKEYKKKYNKTQKQKEHRRIYIKEYMKTLVQREYRNKYQKKYAKEKRIMNPKFRLDCNMGSLMSISLKGKKAGRKWETLVGYSIETLIKYLEKQFDDKMNWENYGSYWWVDHKKARTKFNYICPEDPEFKECWALKNLQPLEKIANIKKGNRF